MDRRSGLTELMQPARHSLRTEKGRRQTGGAEPAEPIASIQRHPAAPDRDSGRGERPQFAVKPERGPERPATPDPAGQPAVSPATVRRAGGCATLSSYKAAAFGVYAAEGRATSVECSGTHTSRPQSWQRAYAVFGLNGLGQITGPTTNDVVQATSTPSSTAGKKYEPDSPSTRQKSAPQKNRAAAEGDAGLPPPKLHKARRLKVDRPDGIRERLLQGPV